MAEVVTLGAIDDHPLILAGLHGMLTDVSGLKAVNTAASVTAFLEGMIPDVVLLDLRLRDGQSPADNVRRLLQAGSRVLVVSSHNETVDILDVLEAGAHGYMLKNDDPHTLIEAIRSVHAGDLALSPELAFAVSRDTRPTRPALAPQERRLVELYATGMKLGAAARRIGVKESTAKTYLARVREKYATAGRPAPTKIDLAERLREDRHQPPIPD